MSTNYQIMYDKYAQNQMVVCNGVSTSFPSKTAALSMWRTYRQLYDDDTFRNVRLVTTELVPEFN